MKGKKINSKITFKELYEKFNKKIIITGVCLNDISLHYFSCDNTPNMEVLKAITISISIPIIFKPFVYNDKLWIDGGVMNNYPIDLFNDKLDDVIGIYLDEEYDNHHTINDMQNYVYQIIKCIFRGMNYNKIEMYKNNTIHIKSKTVDFGNQISQDEILKIYNIGYNTVSDKYNS